MKYKFIKRSGILLDVGNPIIWNENLIIIFKYKIIKQNKKYGFFSYASFKVIFRVQYFITKFEFKNNITTLISQKN